VCADLRELDAVSDAGGERTIDFFVDGPPILTEEDAGDRFVGVLQSEPVDGALFSCDGPTLSLKVGEFSVTGMRYPVRLTPA
jgi:hypothetical protein